MTNPNEDYWPRYAVLSEALKLDRDVATMYRVADKPTHEWDLEIILMVALGTLHRERKREPQERIVRSYSGG